MKATHMQEHNFITLSQSLLKLIREIDPVDEIHLGPKQII